MFGRFVAFLGLQIVGAVSGWLLAPDAERSVAALSGGLLGATLWFLVDALRALRTLRWLRTGDQTPLPFTGGLWGEVLERTQRLLRARDRVITDSDDRLQDFLSALQASPNGVVLLDGQGRIEWCNQTAAMHFGLDSSRDMQQAIGNLVRDPGFAAYLASHSFDHELLMPGRNHSPSRPVNLSVQLYPYGGGRLLLLSRDVTAVEQAEAMRRDFVANVSHEIRTPLTVLAGFVETLQTLELSQEERDHYLDLMARQSGRMQSLVSDLLTLSKLEGSPAPSLDAWCSTAVLMRQLALDAHALTQVLHDTGQPQHEISFDTLWEGEIAGVVSELLSAMGNLVSNAIRYTPPGGRVEVSIRPLAEGRVIFEVIDSGPGIAPEHLPRLTERFYRVDRSRSRETGGTGLGLAIVKHVVQRHGATLTIQSVLGQGSQFGITFPATRVRANV